MLPELDGISALIAAVAVIAVGIAGLIVLPVGMDDETVLTMVLPSMVIFAAIMLVIGIAHGQYRAER